jgi:flavorubredoxin
VLVDSGAQTARAEVQETLEDVLDGDALEAVVLTHADLPHSGNVPMLREVYPDIDVYSSSGLPGVVGLSDDVEKCVRGETMTIGRREMSFINPPLQDIGHSTWIYDETDDVLFTADGIGNTHAPGDCQQLSTEFKNNVPRSAIDAFHRHKLRWLVYVNPLEMMNAVRELVEQWDPTYIAPIHGNPLARESIGDYLNRLEKSLDAIAEEQRQSLPK